MVVRPRVRSSAVVVLWTAVNISGAGAGASVPGGLVRLQQDCCCFYFCSFTYSEGTLTKQPSSTHDSHHRSTVFIIKHYFFCFFFCSFLFASPCVLVQSRAGVSSPSLPPRCFDTASEGDGRFLWSAPCFPQLIGVWDL